MAAAIAGLRRTPLWVQVHGIEAWERPSALHRLGLSVATLITSVSRYTRARLLAWANVAPHRVRVLPNTVDAVYAPRPRRDELVARYGSKAGASFSRSDDFPPWSATRATTG